MNGTPTERLEQALRSAARGVAYPATPDVAGAVRAALGRPRRATGLLVVRAAAIALAVVIGVLATVPPARALIAGWFRIGIIDVVPEAATTGPAAPQIPVTATPDRDVPASPFAPSVPLKLGELFGETTLAEARQAADFQIRLPSHPADLGEPDVVFYQPQLDLAILVWYGTSAPQSAELVLYEFLSSNPIGRKVDPIVLAETSVAGKPALWMQGPYPLEVRSGDLVWTHIIEGRSLVWEGDGITYRLESPYSMEETIEIAASLE